METPPPIALSYETSGTALAGPAWRALRLAILVYAIAIVCRHTFYWTLTLGFRGGGTIVSLPFALVEMALLALWIANVAPEVRTGSAAVRRIGRVAIWLVVVNVASLLIDLITFHTLSASELLRLLWMLAGRTQSVAIPIAVWWLSREILRDRVE